MSSAWLIHQSRQRPTSPCVLVRSFSALFAAPCPEPSCSRQISLLAPRQLLQEAKLELKKSKRKDYYKILAVDKNANEEEIKKAYRKRAMIHHPDRHAGATEVEKKDHEHKFKEVSYFLAVLLF